MKDLKPRKGQKKPKGKKPKGNEKKIKGPRSRKNDSKPAQKNQAAHKKSKGKAPKTTEVAPGDNTDVAVEAQQRRRTKKRAAA